MIKKYDDFKNSEYLSNEREALERELRTRKTRRDNQKYELNINLDLIKNQIIYAIENEHEYTLSIGSRFEELEQSTEKLFHIEFENEELGRVRIFKPKDTNDKGHYEINGDVYETSAKEIRDFYHTLNQEIKGQSKIVRVTESLRDEMIPKTEEEIKTAYKQRLNNLAKYAMSQNRDFRENYPGFSNNAETYENLYKNIELIKKEIKNGLSNEAILQKLVRVSESITDKMVGKNDKDIIKFFDSLSPNELLKRGCDKKSAKTIEIAIDRGADIHYDNDNALRTLCHLGEVMMVRDMLDSSIFTENTIKNAKFLADAKGYKSHKIISKLLDEYYEMIKTIK